MLSRSFTIDIFKRRSLLIRKKQLFTCSFIAVACLTVFSCGTLINPSYVKLSDAKQVELKPDSLQKSAAFYASYYNDSVSHRVFSVNAANMKEIVTNSDKGFSLIVFYAAWCGPCRINTPLVESIQKNFEENLNIIYISSSDWATNSEDQQYLVSKKIKYNASLVIDINQYGTDFTPWSRLNKFVTELKSSKSVKEYGLPTNLLFTNKMELLAEFQEPLPIDSVSQIIRAQLISK